jgi:WD40 repeat protein
MVPNAPDKNISIQGFVLSLAFHPTQPSRLAGGTYNGELMIWDIGSDDLDPLIASSSIDDYFHREAIQSVEWIQADLSGSQNAYLLATVSGDGKVLIWDARENDLSYPSRGFMLLGSKKRVLGGLCLSFSPLDPWLFVIGCETGTIMRAFRPPPGASLGKPQGQYSWKPSAVALFDQLAANSRLQLQHHVEQHCRTGGINEVGAEVVFASKPDPAVIFPAPKTTDLEPHAGPVTVVVFSPFHRKLLLTGSLDGSVRLYDVLQQRALHAMFPPSKHLSACAISAASWSSARPCVFAVAMEMGGVYIYDLLKSRQEPVLSLPLTGSGSQKVTSLVFNPKQRGLLAVGDDGGRVRTFRLPFSLSEQKKEEMAFVSKMMGGTGSVQKEKEQKEK